jgi:DNA polymerase-4
VTLKLKTADFRIVTRRMTPPKPPASAAELAAIALALLPRVELPPATRYRLAGVGLSNFPDDEEAELQARLFDQST